MNGRRCEFNPAVVIARRHPFEIVVAVVTMTAELVAREWTHREHENSRRVVVGEASLLRTT